MIKLYIAIATYVASFLMFSILISFKATTYLTCATTTVNGGGGANAFFSFLFASIFVLFAIYIHIFLEYLPLKTIRKIRKIHNALGVSRGS